MSLSYGLTFNFLTETTFKSYYEGLSDSVYANVNGDISGFAHYIWGFSGDDLDKLFVWMELNDVLKQTLIHNAGVSVVCRGDFQKRVEAVLIGLKTVLIPRTYK